MDIEQTVLISKVSHFIVAGAYLISVFSLFLLRSKIKNIGVNIVIIGFVGLFLLSFLTVFTGHLVGLETIKEIAMYRYLAESLCFLIISIGILVFTVGFKKEG